MIYITCRSLIMAWICNNNENAIDMDMQVVRFRIKEKKDEEAEEMA